MALCRSLYQAARSKITGTDGNFPVGHMGGMTRPHITSNMSKSLGLVIHSLDLFRSFNLGAGLFLPVPGVSLSTH